MAHHSKNPMDGEFLSRFERTLGKVNSLADLGATGEFPDGQVCPSDEGEIRIAIGYDANTQCVVMNFGKPTAWIGFTKQQAADIARSLINVSNS